MFKGDLRPGDFIKTVDGNLFQVLTIHKESFRVKGQRTFIPEEEVVEYISKEVFEEDLTPEYLHESVYN